MPIFIHVRDNSTVNLVHFDSQSQMIDYHKEFVPNDIIIEASPESIKVIHNRPDTTQLMSLVDFNMSMGYNNSHKTYHMIPSEFINS